MWKTLYELQNELDEKILNGIPQSRDEVLDDKILALMVEVSELANETRCFKYWSKKGPNGREVILEEFVDGIHFLLSLGLDFDYRYKSKLDKFEYFSTLTDGFHAVYQLINHFKQKPTEEQYDLLMNTYLSLGKKLNFTEEDIFKAYMDKNKVNHERQQSGY
ncbi:dUTP diphosphatase [Bacillaceae bacterium W0354]